MSRMIKGLVLSISNITIEKDVCSSCLLGKQKRHSIPQATTFRADKVLELIHVDLCGPITPPTPSRKRYIYSFL